MITEEQGQQQFDAADRLEAVVLKGRWKGINADKLWLIECEQGITLEVELNKRVKGLRLLGTPDVTPDGLYQLQLIRYDEVERDLLIPNDKIFETSCEIIDEIWNQPKK